MGHLLFAAVRLMGLLAAAGAAISAAELGHVDFQNSCKAEVQGQFNDATALLHSFEFSEAEQRFGQVEARDGRCLIAAWGMALAETRRAGANAPQKTLAVGWEKLQPWLKVRAQTAREQMYFNAVRSMYEGYEKTSGAERWKIYLARMAELRRMYPGDTNASLFYALGLVWTAGPGPHGVAQRRKALDILLPIFRNNPDNPGAAHYIIHAADTPELAAIALPAARKYATIAPDSPHALHMPSHIFSRLGYWREMARSNEDSARVAAEWVRQGRDGRFDELHALTYLEYAYLQLNEREQAREQIQRIAALMHVPGGDPWAEIDARILFDVQTNDWTGAMKIAPPAGSPERENFDVYWAHAVAAGHLGKAPEARDAVRQLTDSIAEQKDREGYVNTLHLYLLQAQSAAAEAEKHDGKAVAILESAVAFEQAHPVDYPNVLTPPSAECLGMLLLEAKRPSEAAAAFQQALAMAPNTLQSVVGAKNTAAMLQRRSAAKN